MRCRSFLDGRYGVKFAFKGFWYESLRCTPGGISHLKLFIPAFGRLRLSDAVETSMAAKLLVGVEHES